MTKKNQKKENKKEGKKDIEEIKINSKKIISVNMLYFINPVNIILITKIKKIC